MLEPAWYTQLSWNTLLDQIILWADIYIETATHSFFYINVTDISVVYNVDILQRRMALKHSLYTLAKKS